MPHTDGDATCLTRVFSNFAVELCDSLLVDVVKLGVNELSCVDDVLLQEILRDEVLRLLKESGVLEERVLNLVVLVFGVWMGFDMRIDHEGRESFIIVSIDFISDHRENVES